MPAEIIRDILVSRGGLIESGQRLGKMGFITLYIKPLSQYSSRPSRVSPCYNFEQKYCLQDELIDYHNRGDETYGDICGIQLMIGSLHTWSKTVD
jgi:hypothetical protein